MSPRARPTHGSSPVIRRACRATVARQPGAEAVRGGAVGAAVAVLAVAAHGWAGGGYPGSAALALLLVCAAVSGTFASLLPATDGMRARATVFATLGAGQAGAHIVLSGIHTHSSGETSCDSGVSGLAGIFPSGWMLLAHTLATIVCAVLIVAAEHLYAAVSRSVRALTTRPAPLPGIATSRWPGLSTRPWQPQLSGAIGSRAPPVPA